MPSTAFFGIAAGVLSLLAFIPYVRSILAGVTKPARASWAVWTVISTIFLASYYAVGGGTALWLSVGTLAGTGLTALLSLKYGVGGWRPMDRVALSACGLAVILWLSTGSALVGLCAALVAEIAGAVVTFAKTWEHPEQEDKAAWIIALAANIINLFAVEHWDFAHAAYPIYFVLWFGAMVAVLYARASNPSA